MQRKLVLVCSFLALLVVSVIAGVVPAFASGHLADATAHRSCKYCGMDREKFAHSRMLLEFDDGTTVGTCSLHCAAVDLANNLDKAPKAIKVGDYDSKALIDAEKAFWVVGGKKQGVMTRNAKWAFSTKEKADAFAKDNGGTVVGFDKAIKSAYEDMYSDTMMIRDKRKQRKMQQQSQGSSHGHGH